MKNVGTVKELILHLQKNYKPNEHVAAAIWAVDDVMERAKERKLSVTKHQAEEIIDTIEHRQDATIGITWITIDCYLDELDS